MNQVLNDTEKLLLKLKTQNIGSKTEECSIIGFKLDEERISLALQVDENDVLKGRGLKGYLGFSMLIFRNNIFKNKYIQDSFPFLRNWIILAPRISDLMLSCPTGTHVESERVRNCEIHHLNIFLLFDSTRFIAFVNEIDNLIAASDPDGETPYDTSFKLKSQEVFAEES